MPNFREFSDDSEVAARLSSYVELVTEEDKPLLKDIRLQRDKIPEEAWLVADVERLCSGLRSKLRSEMQFENMRSMYKKSDF